MTNPDETECPHCDGDGKIWNNADPTSGQFVECQRCTVNVEQADLSIVPRQPTFEMKMAGAEAITAEHMRTAANYDAACDAWSAMIDAAPAARHSALSTVNVDGAMMPRQPTAAMGRAGQALLTNIGCAAVWKAMFDAALLEKGPEA
jgi:hypothetical protein